MPGRIEHKSYIQLDILIQRDNGFRNKSYKSSNLIHFVCLHVVTWQYMLQ